MHHFLSRLRHSICHVESAPEDEVQSRVLLLHMHCHVTESSDRVRIRFRWEILSAIARDLLD